MHYEDLNIHEIDTQYAEVVILQYHGANQQWQLYVKLPSQRREEIIDVINEAVQRVSPHIMRVIAYDVYTNKVLHAQHRVKEGESFWFNLVQDNNYQGVMLQESSIHALHVKAGDTIGVKNFAKIKDTLFLDKFSYEYVTQEDRDRNYGAMKIMYEEAKASRNRFFVLNVKPEKDKTRMILASTVTKETCVVTVRSAYEFHLLSWAVSEEIPVRFADLPVGALFFLQRSSLLQKRQSVYVKSRNGALGAYLDLELSAHDLTPIVKPNIELAASIGQSVVFVQSQELSNTTKQHFFMSFFHANFSFEHEHFMKMFKNESRYTRVYYECRTKSNLYDRALREDRDIDTIFCKNAASFMYNGKCLCDQCAEYAIALATLLSF